MLLCKKNLTPLQRRSTQRMGAAILLTVFTNLTTPNLPNPFIDVFSVFGYKTAPFVHPSALLVGSLSALALLPVLLAVWVVGNYLKEEPDEFVRALVVRALLWGFAITMVGTTIAGVCMNLYLRPFPLTLLNADLFFVSTAIALRLALRSYR